MNRDILGTALERVGRSHRKDSESVICSLDADWENALCIVVVDSESVICTVARGLENVLCTAGEDLESALCSDCSGSATLLDNGSALVTWPSEGCGNSTDA